MKYSAITIILLACHVQTWADQKTWTPAEVWRDYDPETLPLEIEVVKSWEEDGVAYQKLFFTGEIAGDKKVRLFAIQGAPKEGKKLPGVLHIHGGGQTASLAWVKFWASRGYVAATFDFCGPWEKRTEFSDWGPLVQCNMAKAGGGFPVDADPRSASWYHWTLASRRALTLLSRHPSADPEKLGIFGISVGGTLCWSVAGSDRRVKGAVPIYGCGYNVDRRRDGNPLSPSLALYKVALSPEAHAPFISCPILFLNATNDFHGWFENGYEILASVKGPASLAFTPRYNHHIAPEQAASMERFLAWQLKAEAPFPHSPRLSVTIDAAGVPRARVTVEKSGEVKAVRVFYHLGDKIPAARFWRGPNVTKHADHWEASLPVHDVWAKLTAFANVTYTSGVCLSSNMQAVLPGQLGKARATIVPRDHWDNGPGVENWVLVRAHTDPNIERKFLVEGPAVGGNRSIGVNPTIFGPKIDFIIGTHLLGDPEFQGRDGKVLAFDYKGSFHDKGLIVAVMEKEWTPAMKTYTAMLKPAHDWQPARLSLTAFTDAKGAHPARWRDLDRIELKGVATRATPPLFANFRWENAAQAK